MAYRLVVSSLGARAGEAPREHVFDLDGEIVLVGRRAGVEVHLPHPEIADVHLRLERAGSAVEAVVVAEGGPAVTHCNGAPLGAGARCRLVDGDALELGGAFRLRYEERSPDGCAPTTPEGTAELARAMVRDALAVLGRSAPDATPTLEVVAGPAAGQVLRLPPVGAELLLGRGERCDAIILDPDLSREHLRLVRGWTGVEVVDLGSKNGTLLCGRRLVAGEPARLRDGDRLALGSTTLVFRDPAEDYLRALGVAPAASATEAPTSAPVAASRPAEAPVAAAAAADTPLPTAPPAVRHGPSPLLLALVIALIAAASAALVALLQS